MNLRNNKRGISSIFVTLYLAIIMLLLSATIFSTMQTSKSSLTQSLQTEQERLQERISLDSPGALEIDKSTSVAIRIRVNNTGSITVRIRAIYIDSRLVFDPSKEAGDSYINANSYIWIQLSPKYKIVFGDNSTMSALNGFWTIVTERGTKAEDTGANLVLGPPWVCTANKFYCGPLMLMFDWFHVKEGNGDWKPGWNVTTGSNLTWRILVMVIDKRTVVVTDVSALALVSNGNGAQNIYPCYIDPANIVNMETIFKPYAFAFVTYKWSKPYSDPGHDPQKLDSPQTTYMTFLTFHGYFIEADGSYTPYGQTIPFEAVLVS